MARIYVRNLPFSTMHEELRTLFSQYGTVESVSSPTDRETGRLRGFAFVDMNQADAARAIQNLNGKDVGGRPLRVNEAEDKPRSGGGGRSGAAVAGASKPLEFRKLRRAAGPARHFRNL